MGTFWRRANLSVATGARFRNAPPACRPNGPTFATPQYGLRVPKTHSGCLRYAAKNTLGNPGCVNQVHSFLSCPAAFPVPAVFSLRASEVSAAASAEAVLVSPLPEERRVPADAVSVVASGSEAAAHSGSARDDSSVAPRADGHFVLGAEAWDEAHLAE